MIQEKIKVAIETSTQVKFITSIPLTITVREALPLILKTYQAVVRENYEQHEAEELLHAKSIRRIIKNDFLIPLGEEVVHVINENDTVFIVLAKNEKKDEEKEGENHSSKKEKLEAKKEEKKLEKIKEKIVEQKKTPQESEKKQPKPAPEKESKSTEPKKEIKKVNAKSENTGTISTFSGDEISKLVSICKPTPVPKPNVPEKVKKVIVQTPSESSDSD